MESFRTAVLFIVSAHGVTCEDKITAIKLLLDGANPRAVVEAIEDMELGANMLKALLKETQDKKADRVLDRAL